MIEVQMRVDHDVNFFRRYAVRHKLFRQPRRPFKRINVRALRVPLVSRSGFHQNPLSRRANQQRIHGHQDAVARIGGRSFLPHRLGDHAEHRAAIQPERAVRQQPKFQVAKFHALFRAPSARASNSRTAA